MSKIEDEGLKALLDPKSLLEQLRACETKQFTNAIDLLEQCEERHRRNEKKLSRLTIAASAGGALVGQEAVQEVGQITGIIEQVVSGDVAGVAESTGFDPASLGLQVGPNGEIVLPGGMMGSFGGFGGAGGGGPGSGSENAEKATPSTEDEDSEDEDEKAEEEEEEESEEEEEDEEDEEEEDEDEEEDEEEEDEDEEVDEEEQEEEEQEESEQEEEPEQEQDNPEPDPPSQDQSAGIPLIPEPTDETNIQQYLEEAIALAEVEAIDVLIRDTPNLLESLPEIMKSRQPDAGEVIVGDYETNDPPIATEPEEVVQEMTGGVEVPDSPLDSPLPPLAGIGIPEPGVFGLFFVAAWFCTGWSFRRRRN